MSCHLWQTEAQVGPQALLYPPVEDRVGNVLELRPYPCIPATNQRGETHNMFPINTSPCTTVFTASGHETGLTSLGALQALSSPGQDSMFLHPEAVKHQEGSYWLIWFYPGPHFT